MNTKSVVSAILNGEDPRKAIQAAVNTTDSAAQPGEAMDEGFKTKKVVRNGKVVKKKVQTTKRHKILTAAQKKAIKKAQKAAKKPDAIRRRIKSLRKAATLEGAGEEVMLGVACPDCGAESLGILDDSDSSIFVCPDCGKQYALVDIDALEDLIPDTGDESDEDDDEDVSIDIVDDEDGEEPEDGEASTESVDPNSKGTCDDGTCGDGEDPDDTTETPLYFEDD